MTLDENKIDEMLKNARIHAIMIAASTSIFYQMGSLTLRIQHTIHDENKFCCLDEDTGEEYYIEADSVKDDHIFIFPKPSKVESILVYLRPSIETTLALSAAKSV